MISMSLYFSCFSIFMFSGSMHFAFRSCEWPCSMVRMPFFETVQRKITPTKVGKARPHTDPHRPSPSPPSNESFEALEAHAANDGPCRVQVKSGQVADDDDTCLNENVGLSPQDVLTSFAQGAQQSPGESAESPRPGEPSKAQEGPGPGEPHLMVRVAIFCGADGHFPLFYPKHVIYAMLRMPCSLVRIVIFRIKKQEVSVVPWCGWQCECIVQ